MPFQHPLKTDQEKAEERKQRRFRFWGFVVSLTALAVAIAALIVAILR